MKFGLVHRIMTDALAALGLLSLATSGELSQWMTVIVLVGLVFAVGVPERIQDNARFRNTSVGASVVLLGVQLIRLFLGGDVLELAVEFAAALQVIRLATRRGAAHDQQIILLALLHLVAGTVLGSGLAYGLCFVGFLVVAPGALVLSHLRREVEGNYRQGARDRTGLPVDVPRILRSRRVISKRFLAVTCSLSIPIFLFTAILFVLFPRVGLSLLLLNHSRTSRMVGFSDRVDLGGVGTLRTDPTIAMRVHFSDLGDDPPQRLALYLRGTAFDAYDGTTWSRTVKGRFPTPQHGSTYLLRPYPAPTSPRTLHIDLEPINPPVVFLPPDAVRLKLLSMGQPVLGKQTPIFVGPEGEFKYSGDQRGLRYEVQLAGDRRPPVEALRARDRQRYLAVPDNLTPRIADLAHEWTRGIESPRRMARVMEARLQDEYRYDIESPSGGTSNPLDHFLFESKSGHCEFFSTAMAMMLRTVGVPTRSVTGFVGGTYNRFGHFYAVRQGDAHSWVEVYLDGEGWKRFDPTPPSGAAPQAEVTGVIAFLRDVVEAAAQRWNRHVIGYDLDQQVQLLRSVSRRYAQITGRTAGLSGAASTRRIGLLFGGLLLVALSVYWWRRQRRTGPPGPARSGPKPEQLQVVALYQQLENSMAARGVPRPSGTPPMAHARNLRKLGHPIAAEVADLTEIYVATRYGGEPLADEARRDFAQRARAIRQPPRSQTSQAA